MAFAGLRPRSIGSYDGTDGLTVGDLPEIEVEGKHISFEKVPIIVRVRAKNSKAKHGYLSFLGSEGCLAIQQYLEQRLIDGVKVDTKTDVVHPERSDKKFSGAQNIGDGVRRAMRSAGLDQHPYVWRTYFLSRLLEASNAGKVTDRYVEFWAGHTDDVTSKHYTTGRANLPQSMVEDMRAAYKRAEAYLATVPTGSEQEEMKISIRAGMLEVAGYPRDEADALARDPEADVPALVRRKFGASVGLPIAPASRGGEQKHRLPPPR